MIPGATLGEKWMQDAGVDTTYLYRTDEVSTGTGLILIGPDGQNTVIDGDSSSVKLTLDEVKAALDAMQRGTKCSSPASRCRSSCSDPPATPRSWEW